jgi:hypothetical protein
MATDQATVEYLPRKKAAAYIGERVRGKPYSEITLILWEKEHRGPPVTRIGRDVVYFIPSIEKWLRAQEREAKVSTKSNAA